MVTMIEGTEGTVICIPNYVINRFTCLHTFLVRVVLFRALENTLILHCRSPFWEYSR